MRQLFLAVLLPAILSACQDLPAAPADAAPSVTAASVDHGRYLVAIASCNDCHTPGFGPSGGAIPEAERLMGNPVGFGGPWGVTYAANLRLTVNRMSEDAFVEMLSTRRDLPPMPWPSVRAMTETDKRSIYQYIRALGPAGAPAPTALPPGVKATTRVENMMPVEPAA